MRGDDGLSAENRRGSLGGGLVLLGITVAKVLLVDMANVETLWRVLSFPGGWALCCCWSVLCIIKSALPSCGIKWNRRRFKVAAGNGPK